MQAAATKYSWGLLAIIMLLGALLRLHGLGTLPIWIDEAYSYWSATQSWTVLWTEVPRYETHPALFYSLVKLWLPLGDSELVLRLLPLSLGLLAIPFVYLAGRTLGGARCGLLAAALLAFAPLQIIQAQNLRPYTLVTLASAVLMAAALHILSHAKAAAVPLWRPGAMPRSMRFAYAGLSTGWALQLWSHNLDILLCGCVGLFLAIWWWRTGRGSALLLNLLIALLFAVLLYAPNIVVILGQFGVVRGGWWLSAPSLKNLVAQSIELFAFPLYGVGPALNFALNALLIAPYLVGIIVAYRVSRREAPARATGMQLLALSAIGPWLAAILISFLIVPVFLTRTLTMVQVPAILLAATAAIALGRRPRWQANAGLAILMAIPLLASLAFHALDRRAAGADRAWKHIVEQIGRHGESGAPVFTVPNSQTLALDYYARRLAIPLTLVPLPAPYPAPGYARYPTGNRGEPAIEPGDLAQVDRHLLGRREAWYVGPIAPLFDPSRSVEKRIERRFACKDFFLGSADDGWLVAIRFHGRQPSDCRPAGRR